MKKIKPASPVLAGKIPIAVPPSPNKTLLFSFKYLDMTSNPKFRLSHAQTGYPEKLLLRLKDLGGWTIKEFCGNFTKALRGHVIRFERTSEPKGFMCLNPQLRQHEPWQFEICSNAHGRVHGFFMDDLFYIVWIDPAHKLSA